MLLLLSIDSGTISLKLLEKYIRDAPNQNIDDITLRAEPQSSDESFQDLHFFFGLILAEIPALSTNILKKDGNSIEFVMFFTGDW